MRLKQLPAQITLQTLAILVCFFLFNKPVLATEYQNCSTTKTCTIGEFLFDDSYVPNATASCTFTSRNPDGTLFINAETMTASSSGWYSYTATIGSTEGIYPSQICCTTEIDYLCLDKTISVTKSPVSAADIWGYSNRSLTNFGTLVADTWNYSSRSLSTFGNLISDIWSRDSRTLTGTESATIVYSIAEIRETKQINLENRQLLEQLINKPIVKTFIDEAQTPNLSDKIERTNSAAANLYSGVQNLKSRGLNLQERWLYLSENEIKSELSTLASILKQDINQKDSNILSLTNWLKVSWNSPVLLSLSDQAQATKSTIENLLNDINLYGVGNETTSFYTAISHIEKLDELVGTSLSSATDPNLFGFIKKTTEQIASLDKQTTEGIKILTEIKKDTTKDQSATIENYSREILASNQLPQVNSFFNNSLKNTNTQTNKVLGLMAIVDTNRLLLASDTGQAVKNIWLEEGSIIFRSVATNPSASISQKVSVKYYLPTEIKKEQVVNHDSELTINYDPVEKALFAVGEITLAPLETRTFVVEVEDIWNFKQEEIDSLKTQVNELTSVLKNTSHFTEATAIKSDIVVALDKIMLHQEQAITPENRIRTYRESSLEMNGIEEKIISLKELVLQSNNSGNIFGSNLTPVTLWGIVLIIIAGFAFLNIYLNTLKSEILLKNKEGIVESQEISSTEEHNQIYHPTPKYRHRETPHHRGHKIARIASIVMLTGSLSSLGASFAIKTSKNNAFIASSNANQILGATSDVKYPYQAKLITPDSGNNVPVRNAPSLSSQEVMSLSENQKVFVFRVIDAWAQIGLSDKDLDKGWWIHSQYLEAQ